MTTAEALTYLKKHGVEMKSSTLWYIITTYPEIKAGKDSARLILDQNKIRELAGVLTSPLKIADLARQFSVSYNKLNYYILRDNIPTVKKYGVRILKNKKDLDYVKGLLHHE